jgi:hypothetical protein
MASVGNAKSEEDISVLMEKVRGVKFFKVSAFGTLLADLCPCIDASAILVGAPFGYRA